MDIKDRLRSVLDALGIKITQAAETTGIPYRSWQNYLSGAREPGAEALALICSRLGISADWLLVGEGAMYRRSDHTPSTTLVTESPREEVLLGQFRALPEAEQQLIQRTIEERKRLWQMEMQLEALSAALAANQTAP